jgi:hypothetical protein
MNMIQDCSLAGVFGPPTRPTPPDNDEGGEQTTPEGDGYIYDAYTAEEDGLLGVVTNFIVLHHMGDESGVIEKTNISIINGVIQKELKAIMPKLIEINLDFEPIHEHPLGWNTDGVFGIGMRMQDTGLPFSSWDQPIWYPYGIYLKTEERTDDEESSPIGAPSEEGASDSDSLEDEQGSTAEALSAADANDDDNTASDDANQAVLNNIGFA